MWFKKKTIDILSIGDVTTDTFIRLKDATVHCNINSDECTISMPWGAKIPYDFAVDVHGVGNAANAAVSASRLGLSTAFISHAGTDDNGNQCVTSLKKDGVDTRYVARTDSASNHDFVLWYEAERTILVKHESTAYDLPPNLTIPRYVYLSSVGDSSGTFHSHLADWLNQHPEVIFAFQPGRELNQGFDAYALLYKRANLCIMNKEEAEGLLKVSGLTMPDLLKKLYSAGPKVAVITDGPNGAYTYDGTTILFVPMYPDPKPPLNRTGAGDAFTSTMVTALALGKPLEEALLWGPINSMSVVQKIGAQAGLLSREELLNYLKNAPADYKVTKLS